MIRTPYEALSDHTKYEGAHQLDEHWKLIADSFTKQDRAIQKNADAITQLRTLLSDLTQATVLTQAAVAKATCDDQPIAEAPQRTDWQIKASKRIIAFLGRFELEFDSTNDRLVAMDTLANTIIDEEKKSKASSEEPKPPVSAAQDTTWQHKAGERILRMLQGQGCCYSHTVGSFTCILSDVDGLGSLIGREIIREEGKALGVRNMHDRAGLRSLRQEVKRQRKDVPNMPWPPNTHKVSFDNGERAAYTDVLTLIDARLEQDPIRKTDAQPD